MLACAITARPLSIGYRKASRVGRGNSGSSSKNKRYYGQGRFLRAARGCRGLVSFLPSRRPAMLWIILISNAYSGDLSGMRPGSHCASMDFPAPAAPIINRLWAPVAVISSISFADYRPLISRKSAIFPYGSAAFGLGGKMPRLLLK